MHKDKNDTTDNIIKLDSSQWHLKLKQQKGLATGGSRRNPVKIWYKNANLINLKDGTVTLVDIVTANDIILHLKRVGVITEDIFRLHLKDYPSDCEYHEFDLQGAYVMPSFKNLFLDSEKVFKQNFGRTLDDFTLMQHAMKMKNYLAGCTIIHDFSRKIQEGNDFHATLVENVGEFEEKDFADIRKQLQTSRPYLKVGQDLDELGTVDKKFNKPLPYVLEDFGLLDVGGDLIGANAFEKDDFQPFWDNNFNIIVCPYEDARMGRKPTNLVMLKNMGFKINIASGYAYEVDFFAYMRQVLMTQRSLLENIDCLTEKDVLLMATLGVYGRAEEIDLAVDNYADFIVLKNKPNFYDDIYKMLVWGYSKQDILMTVDAGKIMQINGQINLLKNDWDYQRVLKEIEKQFKGENK